MRQEKFWFTISGILAVLAICRLDKQNVLPFGTERKGITVIDSSLSRHPATACRTPKCF